MTETFRHGTENSYNRRRCRCQKCRAAHAARQSTSVTERAEMIKADPSLRPHGNASTYKNWGCRCDACIAAGTAQRKAAEARRREGTRQSRNTILSSSHIGRSYAYLHIKPFGREWIDDDPVHAEGPGADNRVDRVVPRDNG